MALVGIDVQIDPLHRHATEEQKEVARQMVGLHSLNADDEIELLEMLGLE